MEKLLKNHKKMTKSHFVKINNNVLEANDLSPAELSLFCLMADLESMEKFIIRPKYIQRKLNISEGYYYKLKTQLYKKGYFYKDKVNPYYLANKEYGYSMISLNALMDETMPIKEKGLYILTSHYISKPNSVFTRRFILEKSGLSEPTFNKYFKDLQNRQYLIKTTCRDDLGRFCYEFELFDKPAKEDEEIYSQVSNNLLNNQSIFLEKSNKKNKKLLLTNDRFKENIFSYNEKIYKINQILENIKSEVGNNFYKANKPLLKIFKKFLSSLTDGLLLSIASTERINQSKLFLKAVELYSGIKKITKSLTGYLFTIVQNNGLALISLSKKIKNLVSDYKNNKIIAKIDKDSEKEETNNTKIVKFSARAFQKLEEAKARLGFTPTKEDEEAFLRWIDFGQYEY